jgi:hypothetical protein
MRSGDGGKGDALQLDCLFRLGLVGAFVGRVLGAPSAGFSVDFSALVASSAGASSAAAASSAGASSAGASFSRKPLQRQPLRRPSLFGRSFGRSFSRCLFGGSLSAGASAAASSAGASAAASSARRGLQRQPLRPELRRQPLRRQLPPRRFSRSLFAGAAAAASAASAASASLAARCFDALLGLLARLGLLRIVARRALHDSGRIEESKHPVRRLRADRQPMLDPVGVHLHPLGRILGQKRVVGAELLDEAAVAWASAVGHDDAVIGPLLLRRRERGELLEPFSIPFNVFVYFFENLSKPGGRLNPGPPRPGRAPRSRREAGPRGQPRPARRTSRPC